MSRIRRSSLSILSLLALTVTAVQGQSAAAVQSYELSNGLKVILAPDPSIPTVEVDIWYDAGSRREPRGRSGFAHLFEHLMFQGSENVAPGEHFSLITEAGGVNNAYLNVDNTAFFETLPPNRYNLGLWLEAERMRSLRITEENLRRETEVVKEERRLRYENTPYGMSQLEALFFLPHDSTTCYGYAHSQIGSVEDLHASTLADVQHFFDTFYVPNNATLTIAGSFDPDEARALVEEYFGGIPRSPEPAEIRCEDPFAQLPKRTSLPDPNATLPGVMYTYGTVPARHPDASAINLLVSILVEGESSRFNQRLVREEQVALQVEAFFWERLGPGLIWISSVANQGVDIARVEQSLDAEIERVRTEGVTQEELDKARNNYRANAIRELVTANGIAESLQWSNHLLGDPLAYQRRIDELDTITVEDIRRVANEYLTPDNRAVVITTPAAGGASQQ